MSNFTSRSNSFPSKSHPMMDEIQDHLFRLNGSEATSMTAKSVCSNLASLVNLHEGIKNLIQIPSIQQGLSHYQYSTWIDEILKGSLGLVDLCEFSRDAVRLTKESVQDLESSIRRNRDETAKANDIKSYLVSRKKINKMVNKKCVKNLRCFNQNSTETPEDENNINAIMTAMKQVEVFSFSVLNSVLLILSCASGRSKKGKWSFLSKFTQTSRVYSEADHKGSFEDLVDLHFQREAMKCMDNVAQRRDLDCSSIKGCVKSLETYFSQLRDLNKSLRIEFLN